MENTVENTVIAVAQLAITIGEPDANRKAAAATVAEAAAAGEVIAAHRLPAIFHTGHSGMGTGLPGGGGVRLKWGQPMLIDDVAADFPDMKIVLAHPSWPWVDESLSMDCTRTTSGSTCPGGVPSTSSRRSSSTPTGR